MNFSLNDIFSSVQRIPGGLFVKKLSPQIRFGEHRSVFKGRGLDFYQIRPYDPEKDTVSQIMWRKSNISANQEVYVREAIAPKEIKVIFAADLSSSMDFSVEGRFTKRKLLLESVGMLSLTACYEQNRVGLVGFTDKIVFSREPRSGSNNVYYLIKEIYDFFEKADSKKRRKTDFNLLFDFILKRYPGRAIVFIVSDFVGSSDIAKSKLMKSLGSHHEVVCLFLEDETEFALKNKLGHVRVEDIENGSVTKVPIRRMRQIQERINDERAELVKALSRIEVDSLTLSYGNHLEELSRFFLERRVRR